MLKGAIPNYNHSIFDDLYSRFVFIICRLNSLQANIFPTALLIPLKSHRGVLLTSQHLVLPFALRSLQFHPSPVYRLIPALLIYSMAASMTGQVDAPYDAYLHPPQLHAMVLE